MNDVIALMEMVERTPFVRLRDLREAGVHTRTISRAVADYEIAQVARGLYTSLERGSLQHVEYAAMHFLTGGVVHGSTAAAVHRLSNVTAPAKTQLIVPNEFNNKAGGMPVTLLRTRRQELLTEGVEDYDLGLGISFKITSEARTIIDLYADEAARQHAIDGLSDFLARGGDTMELNRLATLFGVAKEIDAHVTMAQHYRNRTSRN